MDKVDEKIEKTQEAGQDFYYYGKKVATKTDLENCYKYAYKMMCKNKGFEFSWFGDGLLDYDCSHTEKTCKRDTRLHDNFSEEIDAEIVSATCMPVLDESGKQKIDEDKKPINKCKDVKYTFTVDGKKYEAKISEELIENKMFKVKDKIKVQYEPQNPELNRLKNELNRFKERTENSLDHLEWRPKDKKCVLAYQPLVDFCNDNGLTYDKNIGKCSVNKEYCECRGLEWRSGTIDCRYRPGQKETSMVFGKTMTQGVAVPPYCL